MQIMNDPSPNILRVKLTPTYISSGYLALTAKSSFAPHSMNLIHVSLRSNVPFITIHLVLNGLIYTICMLSPSINIRAEPERENSGSGWIAPPSYCESIYLNVLNTLFRPGESLPLLPQVYI